MDNRWAAVKSKCASVKLGSNLRAIISTKPEPVNIITLGKPVNLNLVKPLSGLAVLVGS